MLYPLTFEPILKERIWGGRNLEKLYGKSLPPAVPIGESWEITDRPEGISAIANGAWRGRTLRWLMEHHAAGLLGRSRAPHGRFPLLVKLLDAREKLSLQVHPPAALAAQFQGEPKTEMWYVTHATPDADLFVGLRRGVTRAEFERRTADGSVADCFHRIPVRAGDAMFLPSGRVHALGAGNVILEIQQNSDTTFRVFDWNRVGLDGRPRELHVAQSLACIDFADFEPALLAGGFVAHGGMARRPLVADPLFTVEAVRLAAGTDWELARPERMEILGVVAGELAVSGTGGEVELRGGQFCVLPASLSQVTLRAKTSAEFLRAEAG